MQLLPSSGTSCPAAQWCVPPGCGYIPTSRDDLSGATRVGCYRLLRPHAQNRCHGCRVGPRSADGPLHICLRRAAARLECSLTFCADQFDQLQERFPELRCSGQRGRPTLPEGFVARSGRCGQARDLAARLQGPGPRIRAGCSTSRGLPASSRRAYLSTLAELPVVPGRLYCGVPWQG